MIIERAGDHGGPSAFAWTIFALLLVLLLIALVSLVLDFYYRSSSQPPTGRSPCSTSGTPAGRSPGPRTCRPATDLGGKAPAESEATTEVTRRRRGASARRPQPRPNRPHAARAGSARPRA